MNTGVYLIVNLLNGKFYVGSTGVSFKRRWRAHIKDLRAKRHHNKHLQASWDLLGESAFEFREFVLCDPDKCIDEENSAIVRLDAINKGYNFGKATPPNRGVTRKSRMLKSLLRGDAPRKNKGGPILIKNNFDFSAPCESWTFKRYTTGLVHKVVIFPSRLRRNSFRVVVNGREWSRCIGYDRLLRQTRKALAKSGLGQSRAPEVSRRQV